MKKLCLLLVLTLCVGWAAAMSSPVPPTGSATSGSTSQTTGTAPAVSSTTTGTTAVTPVFTPQPGEETFPLVYKLEGKVDTMQVSMSCSLLDISAQTKIPVKKLRGYLDLPRTADKTAPISTFGFTFAQLQKAMDDFADDRYNFVGTMTLLGMVVVFIGLAVISIVLSQLKHLAERKKNKPAPAHAQPIDAPAQSPDTAALAAAIIALHMHISDLEASRNLLLTWKRTSWPVWRYYSKFRMPNVEHSTQKYGR